MHGQIVVNDRKVNIPSFEFQPGNVVSMHPKRQNSLIFQTVERPKATLAYLEISARSGKCAC